MPSLSRNTSSALGQVLGAIGATGSTLTKMILMLDRLTDAGYSHADTFALNTELRNIGSVEDARLDEEKRDLERTIERLKHEEQLAAFFEAHPNLKPATDRPRKAKPSKSPSTTSYKPTKAKAAGTG